MQKELSLSKEEVNRVESSMLEALATKNAEIEALVNSMEMVKKQAALSEGNLASLQVYILLLLLYTLMNLMQVLLHLYLSMLPFMVLFLDLV